MIKYSINHCKKYQTFVKPLNKFFREFRNDFVLSTSESGGSIGKFHDLWGEDADRLAGSALSRCTDRMTMVVH